MHQMRSKLPQQAPRESRFRCRQDKLFSRQCLLVMPWVVAKTMAMCHALALLIEFVFQSKERANSHQMQFIRLACIERGDTRLRRCTSATSKVSHPATAPDRCLKLRQLQAGAETGQRVRTTVNAKREESTSWLVWKLLNLEVPGASPVSEPLCMSRTASVCCGSRCDARCKTGTVAVQAPGEDLRRRKKRPSPQMRARMATHAGHSQKRKEFS